MWSLAICNFATLLYKEASASHGSETEGHCNFTIMQAWQAVQKAWMIAYVQMPNYASSVATLVAPVLTCATVICVPVSARLYTVDWHVVVRC